MTYRDDHDALLARNDALTREVEELREKAEALEAAQQRSNAETAAAAARRRSLERLADEPKPAAPPPPAQEAETRSIHEGRLQAAFGMRWFPVVAAVGILGGAIGMSLLTQLVAGRKVAGVSIFIWLPLGWWLTWWHRAYRARRTVRWLERLPIHVDLSRYLMFMSHDASGTMDVTISFGELPDDRNLIVRAIEGGRLGATAVWRGDDLIVASPEKDVLVAGPGGLGFDNAPLHRWFRGLVRRLLAIHAVHRIAGVSVATGREQGDDED